MDPPSFSHFAGSNFRPTPTDRKNWRVASFFPPISLRTTFHLLILNWRGPFHPPPLKLATHDTGQVFRPVMARQTSAVVSAGAVVYRLLTIVTGDAGHSRILEPPQIEGGSRGCRYDVLALIGVERDGPLPSQLAGRAQFRVTGRPVGVSVMITFPFIYWHW